MSRRDLSDVDWRTLDPEVRERLLAGGIKWVREQNGGYLPLSAYLEHAITFPRVYVDVAPIYPHENGNRHDILLVQRRLNEAIFPVHWHIAGGATLVRQTVAEKRHVLLVNECGAHPDEPIEFRFAGAISMPRLNREIADVKLFLALTRHGWLPTARGAWFSLDDPPSSMVPHQREVYIPLIKRILAGGAPEFVEYLGQE